MYIVAGIRRHDAAEVELRASSLLGQGGGGDIVVPRVQFRDWYSDYEGMELSRLAANKIIAAGELAGERPTPSSIFLIYIQPASGRLADSLMRAFEFWAWPEPMVAPDGCPELPPQDYHHWSRDPVLATKAIMRAIRRTHDKESRWQKVARKLRELKNPYRLPPANFRFPSSSTCLRDVYRRIMCGESGVRLPRLCRVPMAASRFRGEQHFCDACERLFPQGKNEHGALRELDADERGDWRIKRLWLNGAYRFGTWIGNYHEHYDVQRVKGNVSPPNVFCARRNLWASATRSYVNIFLNDTIRESDIFKR